MQGVSSNMMTNDHMMGGVRTGVYVDVVDNDSGTLVISVQCPGGRDDAPAWSQPGSPTTT